MGWQHQKRRRTERNGGDLHPRVERSWQNTMTMMKTSTCTPTHPYFHIYTHTSTLPHQHPHLHTHPTTHTSTSTPTLPHQHPHLHIHPTTHPLTHVHTYTHPLAHLRTYALTHLRTYTPTQDTCWAQNTGVGHCQVITSQLKGYKEHETIQLLLPSSTPNDQHSHGLKKYLGWIFHISFCFLLWHVC